ncbi:unnamed protein product [Aphanomyces euteiches]
MSDTEDGLFGFGGMDVDALDDDADQVQRRFEEKERKQIQDIVDAYPNDEPKLIDALCLALGWFKPDFDGKSYRTIQEYVERDDLPPGDAVARIAEPIEALLATGKEEEASAYLWDLWYGFLHQAKRTPLAKQDKLVQLLKLLKARPDPPTKPIWSSLWNFDAAASEISNDTPSGRNRWTPMAEIHAHTNVSAFMAQLTYDDVMTHWYWSAIQALYEGLEKDNDASDLDRSVPAAAAWIRVLGLRLKKEKNLESASDQHRGRLGTGWGFWKTRFEEIGQHPGVNEETKRIATETVAVMHDLDRL